LNAFFFIVSGTASLMLNGLLFLLLARVLLSLFAAEGESPLAGIYIFCCAVTEPVVAPTRRLLDRIPALQDSPMDFSYLATAFIIMIVESALQIP